MINTQGMSLTTGEVVENDVEYPPFKPTIRTVFSDIEREELKQIMKEALHEVIPRYC